MLMHPMPIWSYFGGEHDHPICYVSFFPHYSQLHKLLPLSTWAAGQWLYIYIITFANVEPIFINFSDTYKGEATDKPMYHNVSMTSNTKKMWHFLTECGCQHFLTECYWRAESKVHQIPKMEGWESIRASQAFSLFYFGNAIALGFI
jgi:hypothetical protein